MSPTCCGVWPGPRRATAVLFDPAGTRQAPLSLANTDPARSALLTWLADKPASLVIPDTRLAQPFLNQLSQADQPPLAVWLAPRDLLEAIRLATGLTTRAPKHTAALLARWPTSNALRPFLRRLIAAPHPDQLPLL
jgi:hypothetical protein